MDLRKIVPYLLQCDFQFRTVLGFERMFQNSFVRRSPDTISPFNSDGELLAGYCPFSSIC